MPIEKTRDPLKRYLRAPKVYSGWLDNSEPGWPRQVRTIIKATSQARAAHLVGVPLSRFRSHWGLTQNAEALKAISDKPRDTVMRSRDLWPSARDFKVWRRPPGKADPTP